MTLVRSRVGQNAYICVRRLSVKEARIHTAYLTLLKSIVALREDLRCLRLRAVPHVSMGENTFYGLGLPTNMDHLWSKAVNWACTFLSLMATTG